MSTLVAKAMIMSSFYAVPISRAIDGDSMEVSLPDLPEVFSDRLTVRIKGIQTPEKSSKKNCEKRDAKKAQAALAAIVEGQTVDLNHCTRYKYFGIVCNIRTADNIDAASHMMALGWAVPYSGLVKRPDWKCR